MATRSTIALEFADGTVQSIYCHWDGYLDNNGRILRVHYMDPFKVRELIDLGNLSSLAPKIGTKHPFDNPHPYKSAEWHVWHNEHKDQCTFYGRDRGESDSVSMKFDNFRHYVLENDSQEYDYILRQSEGGHPVWWVKSYHTDGYIRLDDAFEAEQEIV